MVRLPSSRLSGNHFFIQFARFREGPHFEIGIGKVEPCLDEIAFFPQGRGELRGRFLQPPDLGQRDSIMVERGGIAYPKLHCLSHLRHRLVQTTASECLIAGKVVCRRMRGLQAQNTLTEYRVGLPQQAINVATGRGRPGNGATALFIFLTAATGAGFVTPDFHS